MYRKKKHYSRKKLISTLLLIILLLSALPVFADNDNAEINTKADLQASGQESETDTQQAAQDDVSSGIDGVPSNEESSLANEDSSEEDNSNTGTTPRYAGGHKLIISWLDGPSGGTIMDSLLTNKPSSNTMQTAAFQLDFSLASGTADAETVQIRIPLSIIDSDILSALSVSGTEKFNYYIDNDTKEIVLYNTSAISSAETFSMQIQYEYLPSEVAALEIDKKDSSASSFSNSFAADMYINSAIEQSSNKLDVEIITQIVVDSIIKEHYATYEKWQSSWGVEPLDSLDYFYTTWIIQYATSPSSTQPYTILIDDIVPEKYEGAKVVGYYYNDIDGSFVVGDNFNTILIDTPSTSSTDYYWYVIIAYPRDLYAESDSVTIDNTALVKLEGEYGTEAGPEYSAAQYTYTPPEGPEPDYAGDLYIVEKEGLPMYFDGFINKLRNGESVKLNASGSSASSFYINANSQGYGQTYDKNQDIYGVKEYTTTLVDDLMYLKESQLVAGDYSIDSFYLSSFTEDNAYVDLNTGQISGIESTDYSSYSPIEVWFQKGGDNGAWILLGTVKKNDYDSYTFTPDGGSTQTLSSDNQVSLPSGVTGIKFVHSTKRYRVSFTPHLTASLYPTEHVNQILEDKSVVILLNIASLIIRNEDGDIVNTGDISYLPGVVSDDAEKRDDKIYETQVQHNYDYTYLTSLSGNSSITKSASDPVNDQANMQTKSTYTINAFESVSANYQSSWDDLKDIGLIYPQNEGTFYDLLPAGAYADISSIEVAAYAAVGSGVTCIIDSVETVDNWQDSSQTMLIIKVSFPNTSSYDNYFYYDYDNTYFSGFNLTYDVIYPWDSIYDYGTSLLNSVAYRASEGSLNGGETAAESSLTNKQYFANLTDPTGSSPDDDTDKNTIYAQVSYSVSGLIISTKTGFTKQVKSNEDTSFSDSTAVYTKDTYIYQLRYRTESTAKAKNIVFYDVIEDNYGSNNHWKGTFAGIDITYAQSLGIDVVVYYLIDSEVDQLGTSSDNLPGWSDVEPEDLSTVIAISVDMSKDTTGKDYVLPASSTVLVNVIMTATSDYSQYNAYNKAECHVTTMPISGENPQDFTLESAVKVSLLANADFEFEKINGQYNTALPGVEFKLYSWLDMDNPPASTDLVDISSPGTWSLVKIVTSDSKGLVSCKDLTEGYYRLVETKALTGYEIPTGQWGIVFDGQGQLTLQSIAGSDGTTPPFITGTGTESDPYQLKNYRKTYDIAFTKVDAASKEVLQGVEFKLYRWIGTASPGDTELVDTLNPEANWDTPITAGSNGAGEVIFSYLEPGDYQLVETQALAGYDTPAGQWRITLDSNGDISGLTAVKGSDDAVPPAFSGEGTEEKPYLLGNIRSYEMPEMGGIGIYFFQTLGGGLLFLGLAILVITAHKRRRDCKKQI